MPYLNNNIYLYIYFKKLQIFIYTTYVYYAYVIMSNLFILHDL